MSARALFLGLILAAQGLAAQSFEDFSAKTGARLFWEPYRNQLLLSDSRHRLVVDLDSGLALGDGQKDFEFVGLDPAAAVLKPSDYAQLLAWWRGEKLPEVAVEVPENTATSGGRRIQVLVIDAGHGGTDSGSLGKHTIDGKPVVLQEKDLTLAVVLELKNLLAAQYPDRNIVLTRQGDTYPTLEKRVEIAHAQKLKDTESILFLSVHFNASLVRTAKGLEFWYVPQNYEREVLSGGDIPDSVFPVLNTLVDSEYKKESRELAVQLAQGVGKELGDNTVQRGLKENPWFVVRMARMPAVLAELGFITNAEEAEKMLDPEYLKKLAHGLYNGLVSFISTYEDHP